MHGCVKRSDTFCLVMSCNVALEERIESLICCAGLPWKTLIVHFRRMRFNPSEEG